MTRFIAVLLLSLFLMTPAKVAQSQAAPQCEIKELFNRRGWRIPGLSSAKRAEAPHRYKTDEGQDLSLDVLKPVSPADSVILAFGVAGPVGRLEIQDQAADILKIARYTISGHVFAYLVSAQLVTITDKKERIGVASEEQLYYYDPDGSGQFTVMRFADEMQFKPVIPDWVKQSKKALTTQPTPGMAPKGHR
jgi:hypothetical protein